ncbi:ankyrin repeat protein [Phlyctema vagabunda]|uniref:Ankyrin repeat protein n=1 Tax=Phlyctema vagabunda TaxID=108571 RepID=A0ABR4PP16_9HELO
MSSELEPYEGVLRGWYISQNMGLTDVMKKMKSIHGIDCSKNQYERQFKTWNFRKKLKAAEWQFVDHRIKKRKREGKDSEVFFNNALVSAKKIKKEIPRSTSLTQTIYHVASPKTPPDLLIKTPISAHTDFARFENLPWQRVIDPLHPQNNTNGPKNLLPLSMILTHTFLDRYTNSYEIEIKDMSSTLVENTLLSQMRASMVESHEGMIANIATALTRPLEASTMISFIHFAVFLVSNNMLEEYATEELIIKILNHGGQAALISLCSGDDPSIVAFTIHVFKASIRSRSSSLLQELITNRSVIRYLNSTANDFLGTWWHTITGSKLDIEIFEVLVSNISSQSVLHQNCESLLGFVVRADRADLVQSLICVGVTALSKATTGVIHLVRSVEVLQALLQAGIDPNGRLAPNPLYRGWTYLQYFVQERKIEMVKSLIEAGADVNVLPQNPHENGLTALAYAVYFSYNDILRLLLYHKADVSLSESILVLRPIWNSRSLLETALHRGNTDIVTLLIDHGAVVNRAGSDTSGQSALYIAVSRGYLGPMKILLENGANVNEVSNCPSQRTALATAVSRGSLDAVKLLLDNKADVNICNYSESNLLPRSILLDAMQRNEPQLVRTLLEHGAIVDAPVFDNYGSTAYEAAVVLNSKPEIQDLLLEFGATTEHSDNLIQRQMFLKLYSSIQRGDYSEAENILQLGFDLNAAPFQDTCDCVIRSTLLMETIQMGRADILQLLIKFGANVSAEPSLLQAAALHMELAPLLLKAGAIFSIEPSALVQACQYGSIESYDTTESLLIEAGKHKILSQDYLVALLNESIGIDQVRLIKILVNLGADVNMPFHIDGEFSTCLLQSIKRSDLSVIELLLQNGGSLSISHDNAHEYAYLSCAESEHTGQPLRAFFLRLFWKMDNASSILALLLRSYSPLEDCFKYAIEYVNKLSSIISPLWLRSDKIYPQASETLISITQMLLENGGDINYQNAGRTILGSALMKGFSEFGLYLLDQGANAQSDEDLVQLAVRTCCHSSSFEVVRRLVEKNAAVDKQPEIKGKTALQEAASMKRGIFDLVKYLLDAGANVNAPPAKHRGITALQGAAIRGHLGIASLLLEADADVNMPGAEFEGRTALEAAAEWGRLDMVQLLINAGADSHLPEEERYLSSIAYAKAQDHFVIVELLSSYLA